MLCDMSVCSVVGASFVTYVIASTFFWHYPHLLHKKKRVHFVARHISHRGGSAEVYENTIRGFRSAIEKGTDMLELDVHLTKDGQVVVFHDHSLKRMTGINMRISDVKYNELPALNLEVTIDDLPGETFSDPTWSENERRIPLLSEVFSQFPHIPINIDIKDSDDRLIEEVAKLINEYQRKEITVWGSFSHHSPETPSFFSARGVLILVCCTFTGILPFIPLKETHYEVFLPQSIKKRRFKQQGFLSMSESFFLWASETLLVSKPMIKHLQRRGIHVYLWVCNSEDEFDLCKSIGATGIMTDKPIKLREFLDKHL